MLRWLIFAIALYCVYKFCDIKGYDLPTIAWLGVGFLLGAIIL